MATWSKDDIARIIIKVGRDRSITPRGIVIALATGLVESNLTVYANAKVPGSLALPHDAVGSDGMSVGVQQQQVIMGNGWWWGPVEVCQDPTKSAGLFYDRLARRDYNNGDPGAHAQAIQGSAFPDRYAKRMGDAQGIYDRLAADERPDMGVTPSGVSYNEYPMWSPNSSNRNGTKVDLFLLHTQEGNGNADSLAKYLQGNQVSYHYTISQAPDGGVTVVDVVDTDEYSWSVLSANARSINLCFAGSKAAWTRDQWMQQSNAIDVAAFIAVQDCKKYGIPIKVVAPPYVGTPGISDHQYVTKILKDGSHTDVGPNFPWDVFATAVNKYANLSTSEVPVVPPQPKPKPNPVGPADDQLTLRWNCLGGQTVVEAVAQIRDIVCKTNDRNKTGAL